MTRVPPGPHKAWSVADEIDRLFDEDDDVDDPVLFLREMDDAHRLAVVHNVMLDDDPQWLSAFIIMLLLSGGIATLGLSQDSSAAVIGSMIIAPLGAPILAMGASLTLAWPRQGGRMLAVVLAGSASVVGAAVLIGAFLPDGTPTAQILARTNPDLRDLGVAVLAGAAGAYAQTRESLSSTLVGVAIAVALVPPLATIGLMLEEGKLTLALGAFTLFAANLIGITVSAAIVLLLTGFVPHPRLRRTGMVVVGGIGTAIVGLAIIAVPLRAAYSSASRTAQVQTEVYRQVATTMRDYNVDTVLDAISVQGELVTITLQDPFLAPEPAVFEIDLVDEVGTHVQVVIE